MYSILSEGIKAVGSGQFCRNLPGTADSMSAIGVDMISIAPSGKSSKQEGSLLRYTAKTKWRFGSTKKYCLFSLRKVYLVNNFVNQLCL